MPFGLSNVLIGFGDLNIKDSGVSISSLSTGATSNLASATTTISIGSATAPNSNQVLTATSTTNGIWRFPYDIPNPYRFKVSLNGNQSPAPGLSTFTKIKLNYTVYDPNNNFDITTNYRYTVPMTGYYMMGYTIVFTTSIADQKRFVGQFTDSVNNTAQIGGYHEVNTSGTPDPYVSKFDILYLVAGSYVSLAGWQNCNSSTTFFGSAIGYTVMYGAFMGT